ncbi:TetR/AcrR family transcriptional regulator [Mycobacterium sp.]|uniref:TetR/AcrR family transcriptional regulator n=1 Tax=Mycobacterium sp. TaxID=1785 RepID=UPI002CFE6A3C|nr:TetR/AcrR family transcriptional regulator [Mycobacterium sp.]HTQ19848.1 TetR/AcrR family transcriptional regulator [Mycobacterium sp.]
MPAETQRARYVPRPNRGDERRTQLLDALEKLLATRPLAGIGIADITRAAGVTRSAFYFYFPTKAAAAAALLGDFREDMQLAGAPWYEGQPGTPLERIQATVDASIQLARDHASLMVAMLDAVGTDPEVREIWESWTMGFIDRITTGIINDRNEGQVRATSDPRALATVLMGATLYGIERDVRAIVAGQPPSDSLAGALEELWHRSLYGP